MAFDTTKPKPPGPFDTVKPIIGSVLKSQDSRGKEMLRIQLKNYPEAFFAFRSSDKILPNGKKSWRGTSYHIVKFQEGKEPKLVGAIWERDGASNAEKRKTEPNIPFDRMRIRIDGDVQNYMAYVSPDLVIKNGEDLIGRAWFGLWKDGSSRVSVKLVGKEMMYSSVTPGRSAIAKSFGENQILSEIQFSLDGVPEKLICGSISGVFEKTDDFIILPARTRTVKQRDLEILSELQEIETTNETVSDTPRKRPSL